MFSTLPSDVKAAVIHGVGPHFSAGLDLSEISERDVTAACFIPATGIASSRRSNSGAFPWLRS